MRARQLVAHAATAALLASFLIGFGTRATAQPANDTCAGAITLQCGDTVNGSTTTATLDNVGTCGTVNTAPGVWYTIVGTGDVVSVTTCNAGTGYDTKISVFQGSCAGLVCVGGNDDMGVACPVDGLFSRAQWASEAGVTYFILVHGFSSATGQFVLSVQCTNVEPAQPGVCYASSGTGDGGEGKLYTIDLATGAATLIGPSGLSGVPGLAIDSNGRIFGTDRVTGDLHRIDGGTGNAVLVGPTMAFMDAIAFDANDVLYGVPVDSNLYRIDPHSGATTLVGPVGEVITGLAFDPTDGQLYGSVGGFLPNVPDAIYRIDTSTGAATLVGTTGVGSGDAIPDLLFAGGQLYGVKPFSQSSSHLIAIDKTTGAGTDVGPTGVQSMSGLACFAPRAPVLIALNDLLQSEDVDQLLEIPDVNTGVAQLIGSLGDAFKNSEAMAVLHRQIRQPATGILLGSVVGERIFSVDDNRLIEIDPTTGVGSLIGPIGFQDVDGIAFDPFGVLWGVTYGTNKLITIDINTGAGTLAVEDVLLGHRMNDIAFIGSRCFVITDGVPPRIYELDVTNGDKLHRWVLDGGLESMESLLPLLDQRAPAPIASSQPPTPTFQFYSAADRGTKKDLALITIPDDASEVGTAAFVSNESSGFRDIEALAWLSRDVVRVLLTKHEGVPVDVPRPVTRLALHQNVPNPFNPSTRIDFDLPQADDVEIHVYDVAGRFIVSLYHGRLDAGQHAVTWDGRSWRGRSVAAGIYRYRLKTSMGVETRSMVLLK